MKINITNMDLAVAKSLIDSAYALQTALKDADNNTVEQIKQVMEQVLNSVEDKKKQVNNVELVQEVTAPPATTDWIERTNEELEKKDVTDKIKNLIKEKKMETSVVRNLFVKHTSKSKTCEMSLVELMRVYTILDSYTEEKKIEEPKLKILSDEEIAEKNKLRTFLGTFIAQGITVEEMKMICSKNYGVMDSSKLTIAQLRELIGQLKIRARKINESAGTSIVNTVKESTSIAGQDKKPQNHAQQSDNDVPADDDEKWNKVENVLNAMLKDERARDEARLFDKVAYTDIDGTKLFPEALTKPDKDFLNHAHLVLAHSA